ncbi:MAG: hypothetical protein K0S07_326 [Chlamydiales bacterium]|jgi:hypothetical protein|nr:hypothetical protein [Chlamydiales bacterium]
MSAPSQELLLVKSYLKARDHIASAPVYQDPQQQHKASALPRAAETKPEPASHQPATPIPFSSANLEYKSSLHHLQWHISWHQARIGYLKEIESTLSLMIHLAHQASVGAAEEEAMLVTAYEHCKESLSLLIDGMSGSEQPKATFQGIPLFLGYPVSSRLEIANVSKEPLDSQLFTGYGLTGFPSCPLTRPGEAAYPSISGTAYSLSANSALLDESAAPIDGIYQGMRLQILLDRPLEVEIETYHGACRTALFSPSLERALPPSWTYRITSPHAVTTLLQRDRLKSVEPAPIWHIPFGQKIQTEAESMLAALKSAKGHIEALKEQEEHLLMQIKQLAPHCSGQESINPHFEQSIQALSKVSTGAQKLIELLNSAKKLPDHATPCGPHEMKW